MQYQTRRPNLRSKQFITLEMGGAKCQAVFDHAQNGHWWLKVEKDELHFATINSHVAINFACDGFLFTTKSIILKALEQKSMLVIEEPASYEFRPIRKAERVNTRIKTAMILHGTAHSKGQFVFRIENRVLNISLSGTQLACASQLPQDTEKIMLLMSLDPDDPHSETEQLHVGGTIVRVAREASDDEFPYIYGIKFNPLPPAYEKMLQKFIDHYKSMSQSQEVYAAAKH